MHQSYSYNNMPKPVNTVKHSVPQSGKRSSEPPGKPEQQKNNDTILPFLARIKTDDIILLAVIVLLLSEDCDDKLLLLALAYIFFSDYFDKK